jgi:hypothetical protein
MVRLLGLAIGVLSVLSVGVAQAQSAKIQISGPGEVVDSPTGPKKAVFVVDVFFDYKLVDCQPSHPDCNTKSVPVCVDYHTVEGTAKAGQDFVDKRDRLSKLVVFTEPGDAPLGTIEVDIIGDQVAEGPETFSVVLTNPTATGAGACQNRAALQVFSAEATIVDAVPPQPKPDLVITSIQLLAGCKIEVTIANSGQGPLPDQAYNPTNGVAIQMQRNGLPWGGIRLVGVDPAKKLKTAGGSIKHIWFPSAANLKLPAGAQTLSAKIDRFNAVTESNEANNTTTSRVFCKR